MREFCRSYLLYTPHGLSDHRSEAFRQKMIRYFQYHTSDSGSKSWNDMKSIPQRNEKAGTAFEKNA